MDKCLQSEIGKGKIGAKLRRLARGERGSELFEVALVLPLLFMLLIGIVWLGRAFSVYQAVGRAAREGARVAVAPTCATCGNAAPGLAEVQGVANDALTAASLDPANATVSMNTIPIDPSDPANYQSSGVSVTVVYPVQLTIPFTAINGSTINITGTASMRQEF